jgi:hypothetical protein
LLLGATTTGFEAFPGTSLFAWLVHAGASSFGSGAFSLMLPFTGRRSTVLGTWVNGVVEDDPLFAPISDMPGAADLAEI